MTGAWSLVRLAWRTDRRMVIAWIVVLVGLCYASAAATGGLYATEADRVRAAVAINANAGIVALYGPILDVHSVGELAMTKMTVTYAVMVMVMALFVVRRHARRDEEEGRAELLGAAAIDRDALLGAAVGFGSLVAVVLGLLAALANIGGGLDVAGSLAFGGAWAGTGLVAVAITALACQVSPSSRTCAGIAGAAIGLFFGLRAVGDTTSWTWLSWLSPLGWNTRLAAYGETRWWVLLLYPALAIALLGLAWVARAHRDLGAGIVPPRPGPAEGRLRTVLDLEVKLHRPMLVAWTAAMLSAGLLFGVIIPGFKGMLSGQLEDLMARLGGAGAFEDTMIGAILSVLAIIVSCFTVTVLGHVATDEQSGRTEQVLSAGASRARVFLAQLLLALGGSAWLLMVTGVALAIGLGTETHSFGHLVLSALAQVPAVWVTAALAALLLAIRPRWAVLGWAVVVLFATLGQVGELLSLPSWVVKASPYANVPQMPLHGWAWGPFLVLTAIAAAVLAASWGRYRTRDIG